MRAWGLLFVLAAGCSSSGSSPSSSSSSSGGQTSDHCFFDGTLSGGVEGKIAVNGCGTSTSAVFTVAEADIVKKTSLGVRFKLVTALKGGELGAQPLTALEIFKREGDAELVWRSTACTLELTKNEKSPTDVFENRHLLEGKGTCNGALAAVAPNTRAALTLTPFTFGAFVDPD